MKCPIEQFPYEEVYEYYFNSKSPIFHIMAGITDPDPTYEIRRKTSHCFSIEYIISGEGAVQEDDKVKKVIADDLCILHPNTYSHYFASPKNPYKKIWIVFDCDYSFIENMLKTYKVEDVFILHNTGLYSEFEEIFNLLRDEPDNLAYLVEKAVFTLVHKIQDRAMYHIDDKSEKTAVLGKKYIDRMINYHINIEKVCDFIKISRAQFFRVFKAVYDITPAEYILQSKINASKILLSHSEQPIGEIAMRFDFANFPHFSRTFKKYVGCTPSEYREQNQNSDGAFKK